MISHDRALLTWPSPRPQGHSSYCQTTANSRSADTQVIGDELDRSSLCVELNSFRDLFGPEMADSAGESLLSHVLLNGALIDLKAFDDVLDGLSSRVGGRQRSDLVLVEPTTDPSLGLRNCH